MSALKTPAAPAASQISATPTPSFGGFKLPGSTAPTAAAPEAKPAGSAFSFNPPASGSAPASGGFGFSATSNVTSSTTEKKDQAKPALGGFAFGGAAAPATGAEKKEEPKTPALGGFAFGGAANVGTEKKEESKPAALGGFAFGGAASSTAAKKDDVKPVSTGGFSLGGASATAPASADKKEESKPAALGGFAFGGAPASGTVKTDTASDKKTDSAAKPAVGFSLPTSTNATSAGAEKKADGTAKPQTTEQKQEPGKPASQPVEVITSLRGKTMEEIINEWQNDLHTSMSLFHRKAAEIAKLDTKLVEHSDKIYKLVVDTQQLQSLQTHVSSTLDYMDSQQQQLDKELDSLEQKLIPLLSQKAAASNLPSFGSQQPATAEVMREQMYEMAESLSVELTDMSARVQEMVETVNRAWRGPESASRVEEETPMDLITKILNEHFNNLQWIDVTTQQLSSRVAEVKRGVDQTVSDSSNLGRSKW